MLLVAILVFEMLQGLLLLIFACSTSERLTNMASLTPAVDQNENLHIHRGKAVDGFKAQVPKPAKARLQERKALKDLSQSRKPVLSAANKKATALKRDKSSDAIPETVNKAPKNNILTDEEISVGPKWANNLTDEEISECRKRAMTDEEISKCVEWANEGIEYVHSFDMREFEARQLEDRVRKEVDKVMFGLREWTCMTFGLEAPVREVPSDTGDTLLLEFEPEVLPPTPRAKSGYKEIDELLELDYFDSMYLNRQVEYKLKEECEGDASFFYKCLFSSM